MDNKFSLSSHTRSSLSSLSDFKGVDENNIYGVSDQIKYVTLKMMKDLPLSFFKRRTLSNEFNERIYKGIVEQILKHQEQEFSMASEADLETKRMHFKEELKKREKEFMLQIVSITGEFLEQLQNLVKRFTLNPGTEIVFKSIVANLAMKHLDLDPEVVPHMFD